MTAATKPRSKKSTKKSEKDIGKQIDKSLSKARKTAAQKKPVAAQQAEKKADPPGFDYANDSKLAELLERYAAGEQPLALNEQIDLSKYPEMPNRVPVMGLLRLHFGAVHGVAVNSKEFVELWSKSEIGPMYHREQLRGKAISAPELKNRPDDSKVPTISNTKRSNGWKTLRKNDKDHFVSPALPKEGFEEGCVFCIASPRAKADLIVNFPPETAKRFGIEIVRLKLVERPKQEKPKAAKKSSKRTSTKKEG